MEIGGAKELVNMLDNATDDKTRKEALKALDALSKSGLHSLLLPLYEHLPYYYRATCAIN